MSSEFAFEPLERPVAPPARASADPAMIVAAAELEAESIRVRAREEGLEDARAQAREEAVADLVPAASALESARAALEAQREHAVENLERTAVEFGLRVAERILAGALAIEPERVVAVVRHSLRAVIDRERVQILVNPDDLDLVSSAAARLVGELGGIEHFDVQAERRVARGGAIIRTVDGEIDATVATKLENVRAIVEAELRA